MEPLADTQIMVHASAAIKCGHRRMQTNVWVVQELHDTVDELWLAFGTGKNFRYIGAHELVAYLGPERSKSLPIFHAITGCNTTSTFAGCGKKTALLL